MSEILKKKRGYNGGAGGRRIKNKYAENGFTLMKLQNGKNNYCVLCDVCKKVLQNTAEQRLKGHSYFDENYTVLLNNGDSNYLFQQLETPIKFYNEKYDHIYINTNGILTFVREFPNYLNQPFPLEYPSIAPFYSNIDTTNANSSTVIVFYKTQNNDKLLNAAELIQQSFPDKMPFEPTILYVATWKNVGSFNSKTDKLNSFQVVIICGYDETYVQFIYDEINWLQAGIDGLGGLPDVRGQAGFISEDGRYFTINGSGTDNVKYLNSLSNVNIPGVWLYKVGPLHTDENIHDPNGLQSNYNSFVSRKCSDNLHNCHSAANCIDNENGFCCQCQSGYYGNGFSCLKNNIPIRVIGSITGTLNGVSIENRAKLQSYILMADGRSYTAINPIDPDIGHTLSLAIPIGLGIGWLFAKPQNNIAVNGYQLTGGKLNHLSTLTFSTGEYFQINQTFDGLNHWDQLAMKIHLSGNLPFIDIGSKLKTKDFIEEYQFISPTKIRSMGQHQITIIPGNHIIEFELEQLITFEKCDLDMENDYQRIEPIHQKVSKINLDYNGQEKAIRIGLLAEIGISQTDSHPCTDGSAICGENTICTPDGEHYNCICQNGYENILDESDTDSNISQHCVDINECDSENNICGDNSYCENNAGGYTCLCYDGYERNNYNCEPTNEKIQENLLEPDNNYDYRSSTDSYYEYTSSSNPTSSPCDKCSSHSICINDEICQCQEGWFGDGFYCSNCREDEQWIDGQCVPNYSVDEPPFVQPYCSEDGECVCPDGYEFMVEENICRIIGNYDTDIKSEESVPCDVDFNCHENSTCEWSENDLRYICVCAPGFVGDGYTCNKIEISCTTQPDICNEHATCVYNVHIGKSECKCDHKYEGNGFTCQLAPECTSDEMCGLNSFCDNTICVCLDDFERDLSDFCVPAGKCGGTYCTDNSICKWDTDQRIQYCECMEGYNGDGVTSCTSIPPACNVRNTCGLYASCIQNYQTNFECVCNQGYYGDGYVCVEEKNCLNTPSLCHPRASCQQTANGLNCVCEQGLLGNGTVCKEIQSHDSGFLLISQGVVIIRVPFNGKNGRPIAVASMAIGLDKDCVDGRIYWGDISAKKIMSSKYDGSESRAFITEGVESPEGIAIDWISRRIYWTDSSKDTIEVANLDNSQQRAIIINKNLVNPRGLAVDPFKQKLYWSDWNREAPKIEMSNLDGTDREIIVSKDLVLPNSLVILNPSNNDGDLDSGELCYADAGTHEIKCLNIFNRMTRQIAGNLSYPFGLTIDNNQNFLWTDWSTKQIESVDLQGIRKTGIRTPIFGSHKMYGMTAITDTCPLLHSICLDNGGCQDERLCLANNKETSYKTCKCTKLSKLCDNENYFVD